jgi:hypothetical protein
MFATTSFMDVLKACEFSKGTMAYELESFAMNAQLSSILVTSSQLMKVCFFTPLTLRSIGSLVVSPKMLFASCMDHKYAKRSILASFP